MRYIATVIAVVIVSLLSFFNGARQGYERGYHDGQVGHTTMPAWFLSVPVVPKPEVR